MEIISPPKSRMDESRSLGKVILTVLVIWIVTEAWCIATLIKFNKIVLNYMSQDTIDERTQFYRINLLEGDQNEREHQTINRELSSSDNNRTNRQCRIH